MRTVFTFILVFSFIGITKVSSQNFFYSVFEGDTLMLWVDDPGGGSVQWQLTSDTVNGPWVDISGASTNNYQYIVTGLTGENFIRPQLTNLSICTQPYYGSVIKVRAVTSTTEIQIGDFYAGGFVFYNSGAGGGYVVSPVDIDSVGWGCMGISVSALSPSFGMGGMNTSMINSNNCIGAAGKCDSLLLNGYSDWFLPSPDELDSIYVKLGGLSYCNFSVGANPYWTSYEFDQNEAYIQYFGTGLKMSRFKDAATLVRAVRRFYHLPTVQQRLNAGETPKQIFDSGIQADSLYGKDFQGGLIFYFESSSGICYIASHTDLGTIDWGCPSFFIDNTNTNLGSGAYNTSLVTTNCTTSGIAADLCQAYSDGTYDDWFLPSKDELNYMYTNLYLRSYGGFTTGVYWSSSQESYLYSHIQDFATGSQLYAEKSEIHSVRAARVYIPSGMFAGGSGTQLDPWLIATPEQLDRVRYFQGPGNHDKWFRQIANIDLNITPYNQGEGWVPLGHWDNDQYFAGHYNGSGFTISGLYINRIDWDQSLFGWTSNANIDSVILTGIDVTGDEEVSGLVAWADSSHFNECYGTGTASGTGLVGGLFGNIDNNSTITNCHFDGNIITTSYSGGGLAGKVRYTNVTNCYSTGSIFSSGTSDAGGLIGTSEYSGVFDSYSLSSVEVTGSGNVFNGGLIGAIYDSSYVSNCFSTGNIIGAYHTGGFIGYIERYSLIVNCYCSGNVTCTDDWNGGFTSWSHGTIRNCYSTGSVSGRDDIGGFMGVQPYSGIIENCYSTGNSSGRYRIGGFIGKNEAGVRIENCYSTGSVSGTTDVGGFVGFASVQTVINSYWDTESSGISTSASGVGLPTYALLRQAFFKNWNFTTVWNINETSSYPYFQWQGAPATHNIPGVYNQNYVTDIDNNIYPTVLIGAQTWMASNLKTSRLNDGTVIPVISDSPTWASTFTPARCWYNNDSALYENPYGELYNWYVVSAGNVCPAGWHVPSNSEIDLLLAVAGGASVASHELRATGVVYWQTPNTGATNSTGFNAVGTGLRWYFDGNYTLQGTLCRMHSSTIFDTSNAYEYLISSESPSVTYEYNDKRMGGTIRCIKD